MKNNKTRNWTIAIAVAAVLVFLAVGFFTGWGPRNAEGWPFP